MAHSLWHFPGIARDRSDRSLNLKLGNYVCSDALMSRLRARTRDQSGNAHDRFKHASQRLGRRGHLERAARIELATSAWKAASRAAQTHNSVGFSGFRTPICTPGPRACARIETPPGSEKSTPTTRPAFVALSPVAGKAASGSRPVGDLMPARAAPNRLADFRTLLGRQPPFEQEGLRLGRSGLVHVPKLSPLPWPRAGRFYRLTIISFTDNIGHALCG